MKIFKTRIPSKLLKIIKKNSQLEPGEGNGNPLQCSCLENPRDRGAWWAAVYGVAQSRTRLKRLSSSGSSTIGKRVVEDLYFLDQHVNSSEVITQARKKEKKTQKTEIDRSS